MRCPSAIVALVVLAACNSDPVSWSDPVFSGAPTSPNEYSSAPLPDSLGCPASLRVASTAGVAYAAWWRVKWDSSSSLMVARGPGNNVWNSVVVADSTDHSRRGCGRPPPAITVDSATGFVHLAYFLEPDAGPGIFFAHSMDSARTFHAAVPILFGRNPSRVSIASLGDKVVVAYEDPNSVNPTIGVALSRTTGHMFESRMQVTSNDGRARQPVVRLSRDSIRLWWSEYAADPAISATRPAYVAGKWH